MTQFRFSNMSKRYGSNQALHDVSFSIQGGRVHALMGENGAGKSTLIKLLAGVIQADAFDLAIDGALVGEQEVLGDLLGDGRCAGQALAQDETVV